MRTALSPGVVGTALGGSHISLTQTAITSFFVNFQSSLNGGPNGIGVSANTWTVDNEGFFQSSTVDLQIVVTYSGGNWAGTIYFDDIQFQ